MGGGLHSKEQELSDLKKFPQEISSFNPNFCELTAIYWAYKNLEADYYGLFHYRRFFCFSTFEAFKYRLLQCFSSGSIFYPHNLNSKILKKFKLDDENLYKIIPQYDIIKLNPWWKDNYDYKHLNLMNELDLCIQIIQEKYPQMQKALDKVVFSGKYPTSMANMMIMKKTLYFEYCEWLFDVLFTLAPKVPIQSYDTYTARIFGFFSEWMFSVWLEYKQESTKLKIKDCPLIFLQAPRKKPYFGWQIENDIKRFYFLKIRIIKRKIKSKSL
ncbi:exopolysaccharide biosynthesis protein [Campylobacter sp. MIT 12-5580]|uniref:DUF4422 domain-containing protein n=1 Tax=Campylobacter sp. MIT 12-5580 TaxID=2040651 RepID=UPI0010F9D059|nr:DUF4422 domain-containing protein [Campylobacter sp. MIT 12-5580]TKX29851.1 exopolysaccharide biosynthesis protein [Campylobacter sp. MIT 12-5580]